jgi:hypothetical protein
MVKMGGTYVSLFDRSILGGVLGATDCSGSGAELNSHHGSWTMRSSIFDISSAGRYVGDIVRTNSAREKRHRDGTARSFGSVLHSVPIIKAAAAVPIWRSVGWGIRRGSNRSR